MAEAVRDYVAIADKYIKQILDGDIDSCKWVKAACDRQRRDRDEYKGRLAPFFFDPLKVNQVCGFLELMPHVKGAQARNNMTLEPWQIFCVSTVFGWLKQSDKKRRFRRSYIEVPRGNGKSSLSSGLGLYMLAEDDELGAEVYSLATTRDQARIVFGDAQQMVRLRPALRAHYHMDVNAHNIHVLQTGSKFEALHAEGSTLDGLNIHLGIIDELHAHKTRTVYDVVETAIGKRDQSLLWVITTAGSDRSGICYEARTFVTKVLSGVLQDDTQFGIIYGIDDDDEWANEESLKKANPNWGISVRPEVVLPLMYKAMDMVSATNNFLTKHLNRWVNADTAWMDIRAWERCTTTLTIEDFAAEPCYIGLDLASKVDIAALVAVFQREGSYYAFCRFYLPENTIFRDENSQYQGWNAAGRIFSTVGDVIDYSTIETDLLEMNSRYEVREIAYDPWQALQLSTRMTEQGLQMIETRATVANFSEPMKQIQALVLSKRFHHDGDPVLTWMASNVVGHLDAKDNIYPRKERPENKIDGIVALIMAMGRAIIHQDSGSVEDFASHALIL